ncbi:hypothetical protein D3C84_791030 [compost metagenome]
MLPSATAHLPGNVRGNVDRRQLVCDIGLSQRITFISGFAVVTQRHFVILLQSGCAVLQEDTDKVIARRHARVDQLFTHAKTLFTAESEIPAHGTVLQIDIGLVMAVLTGDAVQALDLYIDSLVLLELVVLLQPARVFEQHIGLCRQRRNCLVLAGDGEINVDIGERVYNAHRQRFGTVGATTGQGNEHPTTP